MPDVPISVFISYSRIDTTLVDKLEADLVARNFSPWVDRRRLEGGQEWLDVIQNAINNCDVLVVLLTPEAVKSKYVRMEYRYAQRKDKVVIPILYRPCEIPIDLIDIHHVDFEVNYERGLKELVSALSHIKTNGSVSQKVNLDQPQYPTRLRPPPRKRTANNPSQRKGHTELPKFPVSGYQFDEDIFGEEDDPLSIWTGGSSSQKKDEHPEIPKIREARFQLDDDILVEDDYHIRRRPPSSARRYIPPSPTQQSDSSESPRKIPIIQRCRSPSISVPSLRTPTRGEFIGELTNRGGLETYPIVVWFWALTLLGGLGTVVGILTQSWVWAISMVIVMAPLAYALGYRRAVHPALMLVIAVISSFAVSYLTLNVFNLSSHATAISNFWFYSNWHISIVSQVNVGLILGAISAIFLFGMLIWVFITEDVIPSFFRGLLAGTILIVVAWLAAACFQLIPGFGFGEWWNISLYAATIGLLGGTGLGASCFVWWQALFGKRET